MPSGPTISQNTAEFKVRSGSLGPHPDDFWIISKDGDFTIPLGNLGFHLITLLMNFLFCMQLEFPLLHFISLSLPLFSPGECAAPPSQRCIHKVVGGSNKTTLEFSFPKAGQTQLSHITCHILHSPNPVISFPPDSLQFVSSSLLLQSLRTGQRISGVVWRMLHKKE